MARETVCVFESELKDGTINWFVGKSGTMAHILGKLNQKRFTDKGYHVYKRGLTSNRPSILFPNKDRDAGERLMEQSETSQEQWEVNVTTFFEAYPELRERPIKCSCKQPPFYG